SSGAGMGRDRGSGRFAAPRRSARALRSASGRDRRNGARVRHAAAHERRRRGRAAALAFARARAASLRLGPAASRRQAAGGRRPGAHRKRLVGRRRRRPRLLHRSRDPRRAALDIPRSSRRALVSARKVRLMRYAELQARSNFTFLGGASHPEELVERAAELGYAALALTDECSVAGVVRALGAAEERGIKLIVGSKFSVEGSSPSADPPRGPPSRGFDAVVLAPDRASYGALCALISCARRAAPKGEYRLGPEDFARYLEPSDCLVLWRPGAVPDLEAGAWLKTHFAGRLWLAVSLLRRGAERRMLEQWRSAAERLGLPMTAVGDVLMHVRERRALQDTLTAIRLNTRVDALGFEACVNGERHLRPLEE